MRANSTLKIGCIRRRSLQVAGIAIMFVVLALLNACPELSAWRDSSINQMHEINKGGRIEPPNPPIQLPREVANNLPIAVNFTIISHTHSPTEKSDAVVALAADGIEATAQGMIAELQKREYNSHDNPSRILTGVEYVFESADGSKKAYYQRIFVHVAQNTADQCVVTLTGWQ